MEIVLSVVIGVLFAAAFYMIMRRNIVKLILGLILLGHATNLLLFMMGRLVRGSPPLIRVGEVQPAVPFADPLPEALILTAIVIGFGVQAFAVVLIKRTREQLGTDDLDKMQSTDRL